MASYRDIASSIRTGVPLNPDGSIDYAALQAEERNKGSNERLKAIMEQAREDDPYLKIMSKYEAERARQDEEASPWTQPDRPVASLGLPGAPEWQGKTMYATNLMPTVDKWTKGGIPAKDIRFIAETPEDLVKGKEAGATVEKSVKYQEPAAAPTEPTGEQVEGVKRLNGAWGHFVAQNYEGKDPLRLNPIEEGIKKERELEGIWSSYITDPASPVYAKYRKEIDRQKKEMEANVSHQVERATKQRAEMKDFVSQKMREDASVRLKLTPGPQAEERVTTRQAAEFTGNLMKSLGSYSFTPEQLDTLGEDNSNATMLKIMGQAKLKPEVEEEINLVRGQAGLGKMTQKEQVEMVRSWIQSLTGQPGTPAVTGVERTFKPAPGKPAPGPRRVATPAPVAAPAGKVPTKEEALAELKRRGRL